MANRIFQSIIHQMKEAIGRIVGVMDSEGTVIACTELGQMSESYKNVMAEAAFSDAFVMNGYTYKKIGNNAKTDYVVFVSGEDDRAAGYASLVAITVSGLATMYDEKNDKANFIKNVVMDNILPGDIFIKSKELHFTNDIPRTVLLIRLIDHIETSAYEIVQSLFPESARDFVININETDIVLVKEVSDTTTGKELEKLARSIGETLTGEFYARAFIGISTIVNSLQELGNAYKEAQVALEVGKVFDNEKHIISYENLGIGRLIYQLPNTLCDMFLQEVFKKGSIDLLDHETIFTIQKFFENSLNVSETSRKLFVHRNTLVYRLEKVKKLIGLDLREFEDAIIFKVAMMVKKYMEASNERRTRR